LWLTQLATAVTSEELYAAKLKPILKQVPPIKHLKIQTSICHPNRSGFGLLEISSFAVTQWDAI
jgi:hypothetical protein